MLLQTPDAPAAVGRLRFLLVIAKGLSSLASPKLLKGALRPMASGRRGIAAPRWQRAGRLGPALLVPYCERAAMTRPKRHQDFMGQSTKILFSARL
jgi:hypothetical protein